MHKYRNPLVTALPKPHFRFRYGTRGEDSEEGRGELRGPWGRGIDDPGGDRRGLPPERTPNQKLGGSRSALEGLKKNEKYPLPHVLVWHFTYEQLIKKGFVVDRLPMSYAMAAYDELQAWMEAEYDGTLRVRRRRYG